MNKTVKWILIGVGVIAVLLVAGKLLRNSSDKEVKVTVERLLTALL